MIILFSENEKLRNAIKSVLGFDCIANDGPVYQREGQPDVELQSWLCGQLSIEAMQDLTTLHGMTEEDIIIEILCAALQNHEHKPWNENTKAMIGWSVETFKVLGSDGFGTKDKNGKCVNISLTMDALTYKHVYGLKLRCAFI